MKMQNANRKTKASIDQSDAARYIIEQSCHWSVTSGLLKASSHLFHVDKVVCEFCPNPGSDRFVIANFKMSSLENSYRGALAATPDPATYYRRRYLCASPSGGGKGKRHPGKAILAGTGTLFAV